MMELGHQHDILIGAKIRYELRDITIEELTKHRDETSKEVERLRNEFIATGGLDTLFLDEFNPKWKALMEEINFIIGDKNEDNS